jgi:hypothetical protein
MAEAVVQMAEAINEIAKNVVLMAKALARMIEIHKGAAVAASVANAWTGYVKSTRS